MASDNIFSGLKVVDFASFIAGPSAAVILSDFGADVIKVEPPNGDLWRHGHQKSPFGGKTTPADAVRLSVGAVGAPQNKDAKTKRAGVGARPVLSPLAKISPFPRTTILPLEPIRASRSSMTQICPGGGTPRTIFRFTATRFGPGPGMAQGFVAGQFTNAETGMTPMPPLNRNAVSSAEATAPWAKAA